MNTAFNLLKHPLQARQRRLRFRVLSFLGGWLIGLLLAGMVWHGLQLERDALEAEHDNLLAHGAQRRARAGEDKARQASLSAAQTQQALLTQVQQHQRAWARLYPALVQHARHGGWALERLQVDGDRLELQGRIRNAQGLAAAQSHLSEALQIPLTLVNLTASPGDLNDPQVPEQAFVWQGPWPGVPIVARQGTP